MAMASTATLPLVDDEELETRPFFLGVQTQVVACMWWMATELCISLPLPCCSWRHAYAWMPSVALVRSHWPDRRDMMHAWTSELPCCALVSFDPTARLPASHDSFSHTQCMQASLISKLEWIFQELYWSSKNKYHKIKSCFRTSDLSLEFEKH